MCNDRTDVDKNKNQIKRPKDDARNKVQEAASDGIEACIRHDTDPNPTFEY